MTALVNDEAAHYNTNSMPATCQSFATDGKIIMAALYVVGHYIFALWFLSIFYLSIFFLFFLA